MHQSRYKRLIKSLTQNYTLTDLEKIARSKKIIILYSDLNKEGGLYKLIDKNKVIIINNRLSYYHQQIVLAHEIAHAILHPHESSAFTSIGIPKKDYKENEANLFACKLLQAIGFWENENLCIYEKELTKADFKFIEIYRKYCCEAE